MASQTRAMLMFLHSGNDYKAIVSQFQQVSDLQKDPAAAIYDLNVLTLSRATRF